MACHDTCHGRAGETGRRLPGSLTADRVTLHAARVGRRVQHAVAPGDRADPAERPRWAHGHLVTACAQLRYDLLPRPLLDVDSPRSCLARVERGGEMAGVERRRVDRLLQVHPGMHVAE